METKAVCLKMTIGHVVVRGIPVSDAGAHDVNAARIKQIYRDAARCLIEDTQSATVDANGDDTPQSLDP